MTGILLVEAEKTLLPPPLTRLSHARENKSTWLTDWMEDWPIKQEIKRAEFSFCFIELFFPKNTRLSCMPAV